MRNHTSTAYWTIFLAGMFVCMATTARAGEDDGGGPGNRQLLDVSYLPSDIFAVWITHPQRIAKTPVIAPLAKLERDALRGQLAPLWGIDFKLAGRRIETVQQIFAISTPKYDVDGLPRPGTFIYRFAEPVDGKKLMEETRERAFEEADYRGRRYYRCEYKAVTYIIPDAFFQPDPRTIVFSNEPQLRKILFEAAKPKPVSSPLLDRLRKVDARSDMIGAVLLEPAWEFIEFFVDDAKRGLPRGAAAWASIPKQLDTAVMTISLTGSAVVEMRLDAKNREAAEKVLDLATLGRDGLRDYLKANRKQMIENSRMPLDEPAIDLVDQMLASLSAKVQDNQVVVSIRRPAVLEAFIAGAAESIKSEQESRRVRETHRN